MLFWRLGGVNSVKQTHWGKDDSHQPPVKRGVWCFPFPHHDYFFAYHQWESKLPKKYAPYKIGEGRNKMYGITENMTEEEASDWHNERERLLEEIKKRFRPSKFWYGGRFYSHIPHSGGISQYNTWFLWDNVKEWAEVAKKKIWSYNNYNGEVFKIKYSADHLEIFIPNL